MHEDYASMMPEVEALQCCDKDILLASYHKTGKLYMDLVQSKFRFHVCRFPGSISFCFSPRPSYYEYFVCIVYRVIFVFIVTSYLCKPYLNHTLFVWSTWLESILTLIVNNGDPESLAEGNELSKKYKKFAFMEFKWSIFPSEFGGPRREIDLIKEQSSPRTMRTHLPYCLLPQDVERNHPKVRNSRKRL